MSDIVYKWDWRRNSVRSGIILLSLLIIIGCDPSQLLQSSFPDALVDVIFYVSADNKEEENVFRDVFEMMSAVPIPGYEFWILYDSPQERGGISSGLYNGRGGYWENLPLSTIGLAEHSQLNMGEGQTLRKALEHIVRRDTVTLLIIAGEGASVYDGIILDRGSDDYLTTGEIAEALSAVPVDLLIADIGFSGSFEFLYEISRSIEDPPLMLLSPGPFPREGRDYLSLFSTNPGTGTLPESPDNIAVYIRDQFIQNYENDPLSTQFIADPAQTSTFLEYFNPILEALLLSVDEDEERRALRSDMMFSRPSYYETPGNLHLGLSGILESFSQSQQPEEGSALMSLMSNANSSLLSLYPNPGDTGELTLFFVPLLSNGSPSISYPPVYDDVELAFAEDTEWYPDIDENKGLLHRLWTEDLTPE